MTTQTQSTPVEALQSSLFFSAGTLAFYDTAIWHHDLPADAVQIEAESHADLMTQLSEGLVLAADLSGCPIAVTPPEPSDEMLSQCMRQQRDGRIADVQWLIERHQSELALSRPTTLSEAEHFLVLQYVQDLRDVPAQSGFPTAIEWPVTPDVAAR